MPLAKRIIPTMLVKDRQLVITTQFANPRVVGSPEQAVRVHNARGVDELLYLDIGAGGRGPDFEFIERITTEAFMPITVGGGVRDVEDVRRLLHIGADKVAAGALLHDDPGEVEMAADCFGSQALVGIVVGPGWGGGGCPDEPPETQAVRAEACGVGELYVQSLAHDGMANGYALHVLRAVVDQVVVPVIAGSGCSCYDDMHEALEAGAAGVAAGAFFQFTDATPAEAALHLAARGHEVRT